MIATASANGQKPKQKIEIGSEDRGGQATALVKLAERSCRFFHCGDEGYATIGKLTIPLRSRNFRRKLGQLYYQESKKSPSGESIAAAINTLEGIALYTSPGVRAWLRVAEHEGAIYLDLGTADGRAVRITKSGWTVCEAKDLPVRFYRTRNTKPLPEPESGGTLDDLRRFLNIANDDDLRLLLGWMVYALQPNEPFPILAIRGDEGTGKSWLLFVIRSLTDPGKGRAMPKDERDLSVAAANSWVLALSNLSRITREAGMASADFPTAKASVRASCIPIVTRFCLRKHGQS